MVACCARLAARIAAHAQLGDIKEEHILRPKLCVTQLALELHQFAEIVELYTLQRSAHATLSFVRYNKPSALERACAHLPSCGVVIASSAVLATPISGTTTCIARETNTSDIQHLVPIGGSSQQALRGQT